MESTAGARGQQARGWLAGARRRTALELLVRLHHHVQRLFVAGSRQLFLALCRLVRVGQAGCAAPTGRLRGAPLTRSMSWRYACRISMRSSLVRQYSARLCAMLQCCTARSKAAKVKSASFAREHRSLSPSVTRLRAARSVQRALLDASSTHAVCSMLSIVALRQPKRWCVCITDAMPVRYSIHHPGIQANTTLLHAVLALNCP